MELLLALIGLSTFLAYLLFSGFMADISYHFLSRSICLIDRTCGYPGSCELTNACLKNAEETTQKIVRILWGIFIVGGIMLFGITLVMSVTFDLFDKIFDLFDKIRYLFRGG